MPVPTLVTDLSTTLASNSPAGSDNVFPDLDNYLRAMSGFIASIRDNSGNGWVSPYLPLTYSAGTANGVVYLNGSKVVTTGSALVFDGSNLGLGVTPSAWQADWNVYQASRDAAFGGADGGSVYGFMSVNAYADGSASPSSATWRYKLTGSLASKYEQTSGMHQWFTAPTGTAGNAISFTQAMTLDASGNLGVGTSSPAQRLDVVTTSATVAKFTRDLATDVSLTIGADNDGAIIGTDGVNVMRMFTGGTERARITSGGDLLVGTTSSLGTTRFNVVNSGGPAIYASGSTAGARFDSPLNGTETVQVVNTDTTGNNLLVSFYTDSAPTFRGAITYNRGTGLISYGTSSDYRAKDIIGPVQDPGATIDALKVYEGKMKGATQSRPMLVAHEAQAVAPYAVTGEKDAVNEDGAPIFQQMDVSSLVPLLLAEIQSLRARVAALEAA